MTTTHNVKVTFITADGDQSQVNLDLTGAERDAWLNTPAATLAALGVSTLAYNITVGESYTFRNVRAEVTETERLAGSRWGTAR
jgi:hypothetical protein